MTAVPRLARIVLYPLKGGRGVEVDAARLRPYGLDGDRQLVVTAVRSDMLLTQLEVPALARMSAHYSDRSIALGMAGHPALEVRRPGADADCFVRREDRHLLGTDCGQDAANWVSQALGHDTRLVQLVEMDASRHFLMEGSPVTLVTEASLASISGGDGSPFDDRRLRANLFVTGTEAFEEDRWRAICVGGATLASEGPRTLCRVLEIDQVKGCRSSSVLRNLVAKRDGKATFGVNLRLIGLPELLTVGARVEVLAEVAA